MTAALCAGIVFGSGLIVSRMYDPQRVLAFLYVAGFHALHLLSGSAAPDPSDTLTAVGI